MGTTLLKPGWVKYLFLTFNYNKMQFHGSFNIAILFLESYWSTYRMLCLAMNNMVENTHFELWYTCIITYWYFCGVLYAPYKD